MLTAIWHHDDPWGLHVSLTAHAVGGRCDRVFVECVDSAGRAPEVERALEYATQRDLRWVAPAVLSLSDFLELDLLSLRIFPGFDAVWFLRGDCAAPQAPPFKTYFATRGETSLPQRSDGAGLVDVSWDEVERWMQSNGTVAGVISGFADVLVVSLAD